MIASRYMVKTHLSRNFCRLCLRSSLILFISILMASSSNADNPANETSVLSLSKLRLSGYGTISTTFDDRTDMAPMRDFSQRPDHPFRNDITWELDSRLGLQADYRFSDKMEFVIQGALRDQVVLDAYSSLESCFIGLRPYPWLDVRFGRLGYDVFLMSDTRNIGYSYLWVRPPTEFYGFLPIFSVDGVDAAYTIDKGSVQWKIKAQAGSSRNVGFPMGDDAIYNFETKSTYNLAITRQSGPWRLKAGYSRWIPKNEATPFKPLHEGLDAVAAATSSILPDISAEARDLRENLTFKDIRVSYTTLGAAYDDLTWVLQAEISLATSTADALPLGYMGYLGIGRRFGDFTPYTLFSIAFPENDIRGATSDWNPIGQEAFHQQALHILNSTRLEQKSCALGIRWDFSNQAAFKLQWDNIHLDTYGYGMWWRQFETLKSPSTINLATFSMEFVF
ncbi:MAG: hypothetical protein HQK65_22820 [Desulfamplus sp.]|nr:hypothetical protein [Desulfamplus sp.]